ncbi:Mitomycin biosynthesis 6-O-methyltransferase [Kordia antarctica]|uniref:Mitomycin biosynthesis 6-O-methyltransferase n=1 Tax=Kordia antarctica TaxID=1218801 RepID=A0A7L4ZEZ1_9FLAO|nr:methyltransferase [Kordia antarctica]QHI35298.1 Mitomycin biosynthesis 6-O-methyltransferase [Kordia antarctica]
MNKKDSLKSFFTEHWKYLAVSTACKLNIFDVLAEKGKTAIEISQSLSLHKKNTKILLDALYEIEFLSHENDTYILTENSIYLTENHSESLKYACMHWATEHLTTWQNLDFSIRTNKSAFEDQFGASYFDYLNQDVQKLTDYHKAMNAYARDDYKKINHVIDFSIHKSIMDVGGSYGALLQTIKQNNINVKCYLFDLDLVIESQEKRNDITYIKGDFFERISTYSEAIILSRILHDWNDEKAIKILNNTFKSLPENGFLYVIENCSDKLTTNLSLLSLNMLAVCESYERSSLEYISLANKADFKFREAKKLNQLQTILIFTK